MDGTINNLARQAENKKREVMEMMQRTFDRNRQRVQQIEENLTRIREMTRYRENLEKSDVFDMEKAKERLNIGYDFDKDSEKEVLREIKMTSSIISDAINNNDSHTLQYASTQLEMLSTKLNDSSFSSEIKTEMTNAKSLVESEEATRIMERDANIMENTGFQNNSPAILKN